MTLQDVKKFLAQLFKGNQYILAQLFAFGFYGGILNKQIGLSDKQKNFIANTKSLDKGTGERYTMAVYTFVPLILFFVYPVLLAMNNQSGKGFTIGSSVFFRMLAFPLAVMAPPGAVILFFMSIQHVFLLMVWSAKYKLGHFKTSTSPVRVNDFIPFISSFFILTVLQCVNTVTGVEQWAKETVTDAKSKKLFIPDNTTPEEQEKLQEEYEQSQAQAEENLETYNEGGLSALLDSM